MTEFWASNEFTTSRCSYCKYVRLNKSCCSYHNPKKIHVFASNIHSVSSEWLNDDWYPTVKNQSFHATFISIRKSISWYGPMVVSVVQLMLWEFHNLHPGCTDSRIIVPGLPWIVCLLASLGRAYDMIWFKLVMCSFIFGNQEFRNRKWRKWRRVPEVP